MGWYCWGGKEVMKRWDFSFNKNCNREVQLQCVYISGEVLCMSLALALSFIVTPIYTLIHLKSQYHNRLCSNCHFPDVIWQICWPWETILTASVAANHPTDTSSWSQLSRLLIYHNKFTNRPISCFSSYFEVSQQRLILNVVCVCDCDTSQLWRWFIWLWSGEC